MKVLEKIFKRDKITQKDYEFFIRNGFERIKNPTKDEKMEYKNSIHGGKCDYCGEEWIQRKIKNDYFDYKYHVPGCECLNKIKERKEFLRKESFFNIESKIPKKFYFVNIKDMDFNVKDKTRIAIEKIKNYLKKENFKDYGLVIYGDVGVGKTHLAVSSMKLICIKEKKRGLFLHMSDFVTNVIKYEGNYIQDILKYDVLLLDDFDKTNIKSKNENTWVNEQIFSLINGLTSNKKIIIGTSNVETIEQLTSIYNDAIVSRLIESCFFVNIQGNDYRLKKKGIA